MPKVINKNLIALIILTMLGSFGIVRAAFNEQINFQGKLTNSSNLSVADGNNCMKFSLFTGATGGSAIWEEEWKASTSYVVSASGLFSVLLGSNTSLSSVNFNQSALYLQVEYDPACDGTYEESFFPRKLLGATPFAFEAKQLAGYSWATPDAIGTSTPNTGAFTTLSSTSLSSGSLTISGNIGIGTTTPLAKLHVEGQCVTGDTMLPIVSEIEKSNIKNQNDNLKLKIDYIQIKDVQAGDYTLSLNEESGKLEPAKIKGLLDMGVKQIFELKTEDGKTIRTTGNHPYLSIKKSAFGADSLESRNGSRLSPTLTFLSIANQEAVSSPTGDNFLSCGLAGNRTPETLLSRKSSNHSGPTASSLYQNDLQSANWTKVAELSVGDEIAVASDDLQTAKFVKIKEINILPAEQVYDIEVEGTHNFIGNGIVAHNTYINGAVGIATTGPDAKLDVLATSGAQLRLTYTDGSVYADFTTNATGDLTIGASSGNVFFPKLIGGAATTADLYLQTTSGVGATGADMHFLVGNNGGTEAMTILNNGNVGIGTTSPGQKLTVNGTFGILEGGASPTAHTIFQGGAQSHADITYTLPTADGSSGQMLSTNGSGTLSWVTDNAGPWTYSASLYNLYSTGAGNGGTGTYNFISGLSAGNSSMSGDFNNFIGGWTGGANTSGYANNFLGPNAGGYNQSGNNNNFLGNSAGYLNTTGSENNFFGVVTGQHNNGSYNNFIGGHAGLANTSGNYNTFIGDHAGISNSTGSNSLMLGAFAGYNETAANSFYIGNVQQASLANDKAYSLMYGVFSGAAGSLTGQQLTINGNVGIGTTAPGALLNLYIKPATTNSVDSALLISRDSTGTVAAGIGSSIDFANKDSSGGIGGVNSRIGAYLSSVIYGGQVGNIAFYNQKNGGTVDQVMTIQAGNVGIGTTTPGGGTGSSVLSLFNSTATPTAAANTTHLYSYGGEGYWMDSAGNTTLQTPHDLATGEWIFNSYNANTGKTLRVNMEQMSKFIDEVFGTDFVFDSSILNNEEQKSQGAVEWLASKVKDVLAGLGMAVENGVATLKQVVADKFTAKTARIEKMEMVDSATGEIWCAWIKNGEWVKAKGECDKIDPASVEVAPMAPVKGCLDSQALNYNPKATVNGGGCLYPNQGSGESIEVENSTGTSPAEPAGNAPVELPVEIVEPAVESAPVGLLSGSIEESASPTN